MYISMWSARALRSSTSPPVIATAARNVAASTRSGIVSCFAACSSSTPSTSIVDVPAPSMCAPIALRRSARSEISGSRAALSMTVVPLASAAAMRMFSVAPTLGNSSVTAAPRKPVGEAADIAVLELEGRAERLEARQVHVDRPRTEVVATRERDAGLAAPGEQGTEHADRRPHPLDQVIRRLGVDLVRRAKADRGAFTLALDADRAEQLGHRGDVRDARDVGEDVLTRCEQRRRHQQQRRVLRS